MEKGLRMTEESRSKILITVITSALMIAIFAAVYFINKSNNRDRDSIIVGFLYDGDESTPYTANFIRAQKVVERKYGDRVEVKVKRNVNGDEGDEKALSELIAEGCDLIFINSYGETARKIAGNNPDVQFCQVASDASGVNPASDNYHTFMGEIYQGRYITGVVAGMKLKEMIDNGDITVDEAKVGYVAAYPYAEVISGYTAFFLGVRSVVPDALMEVKYTNTWSAFALAKKCALELIERGCVIISQHSDTTGPALACEQMYAVKQVYHVSYNQSSIDAAPTTSLVGSRINWEPYISGAVEAVLRDKKIEKTVEGDVHGNDIGAGLDMGWVEILELNSHIAAPGSKEKIDELTEDFIEGRIEVYKGDYIGVNPDDESDTIYLKNGYTECENCSAPTFSYVLKGVINVVE